MKTPKAGLLLLTGLVVGCGGSESTTGSGGDGGGTTGTGATASAGNTTGTSTTSTTSSTGTGGSSPSPGCGNLSAPTGANDAATIDVAGVTRTYAIYVPETYDANVPLALVFGWHGLGGTGAGIRSYLGLEEASAGAAILVYPDAHGQPDGGWNLEADGTDIAIFDALLEDVSARYCIDQTRVLSTGFSYGGWMANATACFRADRVHAVAPIAGGGPFGGCSAPVAAFVVHGSDDGAEPVSSGVQSRDFWVGQNGCTTNESPVDPAPCVAYGGCQSGSPVAWCEHSGMGGHVIPPFAPSGIWSFFTSLP